MTSTHSSELIIMLLLLIAVGTGATLLFIHDNASTPDIQVLTPNQTS